MPDDQTNAQHLLAQWATLMQERADFMYDDTPLPMGHRANCTAVSDALTALGYDINPDVSGLPTWKYYGPPA